LRVAVRLSPERLFSSGHACFYLTGEDADAIFEAAEALLARNSEHALILRVDVNELARVETESRDQGLFGMNHCHALVRNAASARPKEIEHLVRMATSPPKGLRLIICAPGIEAKKTLHKRLTALPELAWCAFQRPDEKQFQAWLKARVEEAGLVLSDDAFALFSERMHGMRLAARQAVERLRLYDNGEGAKLDMQVVGDLLGERSPQDIAAYCHAVAERSSASLSILRRLLREQQVSEIQVLGWLSTRMQQLLMYCWYAATDRRSASGKARLFGEARKYVPQEARLWQARELMQAMERISRAEMLLKGASIEGKSVVLERLTMDLV